MRLLRLATFVAASLLPAACLTAQQPPVPTWQAAAGSKLAFDVASVKLNNTATGPATSNVPLDSGNLYSTLNHGDTRTPAGGYFVVINQPVWRYIVFAWKLSGTQELALRFNFFAGLTSSRLPAWVTGSFDSRAEAYDIEARAEGSPTKDQMRVMMQSLLAERFHFSAHLDTREAPVFALVLQKPGILGPALRIHPASDPCNADTPPPGDLPPACGVIARLPPTVPGRNRIGGRSVTLDLLATSLPTQTGMATLPKPVIDQTGLKDTFDFTLEWAPEQHDPTAAQPEVSGASFQQALKQQLGLDLKSTRGPVDLLIVDHIERPTPN